MFGTTVIVKHLAVLVVVVLPKSNKPEMLALTPRSSPTSLLFMLAVMLNTSSNWASVSASSAAACCVVASSTGFVSAVASGVMLSSFLQLVKVNAVIRLSASSHLLVFKVYFIKINFKN